MSNILLYMMADLQIVPLKNNLLVDWKKANIKVLDLSANSNNYGWPKFL